MHVFNCTIVALQSPRMDLFDDLPPPSKATPTLFDDLPPGEMETGSMLGKRLSTSDEEGSDSKQPKLDDCHLKLQAFLGERRGEREDMQDAHLILNDCSPTTPNSLPNHTGRVAFFGVFDGHAGPRASKFAADHLHKNIMANLPKGKVQNLDREVKKCLIEAFKKTDEEFLAKASAVSPSWKDGTTVTILLVLDNTIYSANVGDSRAVLCRQGEGDKLTFVGLTKDHGPSHFEERKRIEKAGGTVHEGRVMGILEVSRSIGDGRFKGCGVICTPDVFRSTITEKDQFILIACDGLWKVFNAEDAAKFITEVLEDESIQLPDDDKPGTNFESVKHKSLKEARYEEACNRLAVEAVKRGCTDNVTVMIIDILHHSQQDSVTNTALT